MASEAIRMGRIRALRLEVARTRERERFEREAYARRLFSEAHSPARKPPQSPEERERRRAAAARARDAEATRLSVEMPIVHLASDSLDHLRYHTETVRRRQREVFWPTDPWVRGRALPRVNDDGDVPGQDATGRVLALIGDRLVYLRRTRLFASLTIGAMQSLKAAIRDDEGVARRLGAVREARALFWELMRAMRVLDTEWGL